MATISGQVERITENNYQGKSLYGIKFVDNEEYYNSGEQRPSVSEGDKVTVDFTVNARGRNMMDLKTLKVTGNQPLAKKSNSKGGGKSEENWEARAEYWAEKDRHERRMEGEWRYRNALGHAITWIEVLDKMGALPVTKANQATPAKKHDALEELRLALAARFFDEFEGAQTPVGDEATKDARTPVEFSDLED